jgi:hypothetical protein
MFKHYTNFAKNLSIFIDITAQSRLGILIALVNKKFYKNNQNSLKEGL